MMRAESHTSRPPRPPDEQFSWRESLPLFFVHAGCLAAFWTGVSRAALIALGVTYVVRVFALTAGYHRYFSHNSFRTGRAFQFVLAALGASAAQLGPLWWAGHHRRHHAVADTEDDVHSPRRHGLYWSHLGWLLCRKYARTDLTRVPDFARFPELRWLDRHTWAAPLALGALLYGAGAGLARARPAWGASGPQLLVWGFFISTVLVYHVTFCINSLMHLIGRRRYETPDTSRNSFWLALLSGGEGWHNNHHRYPISARQGFFWWEVDWTYYGLRLLAALGLIWDLRAPPPRLLQEGAQ